MNKIMNMGIIAGLFACAAFAVIVGAALALLIGSDIICGRIHGWELVPAVGCFAMLGIGGIASGVVCAALAWQRV